MDRSSILRASTNVYTKAGCPKMGRPAFLVKQEARILLLVCMCPEARHR